MSTITEYTFHHVPSRIFSSLCTPEVKNNLMQWSMKGRLRCQCYAFDENFKSYEANQFIKAFFNSPSVLSTLKIEEGLPENIDSVVATPVACSVLTMNMFDRLIGVVTHSNGNVKGCFDCFHDGILISDQIKKMLLDEESENYNLFTDTEREEFIFRLFKHIYIGGELVQGHSNINVYLKFVKNLYKDIIAIQKDQCTQDLRLVSYVYEIKVKKGDDVWFPSSKEHINTFAYFIVNPVRRHVIILSHVFGIGDF